MKIFKIALSIRIAALSLAAAGPIVTLAQDAKPWPQKPVRIVIPTAPGAPIDIIARLLQPKLQAQWGQPVVIENKPGAGGNIGMIDVARSSDDHTLLGGPTSMNTVNPHLYKKIGIDPIKDLVPVTYLAAFNSMLVCNPKLGLDSAAALISRAKANQMAYASSGAGGPGHMITEDDACALPWAQSCCSRHRQRPDAVWVYRDAGGAPAHAGGKVDGLGCLRYGSLAPGAQRANGQRNGSSRVRRDFL